MLGCKRIEFPSCFTSEQIIADVQAKATLYFIQHHAKKILL
jgi:hypothetical protein